jgi:hypothetical protein
MKEETKSCADLKACFYVSGCTELNRVPIVIGYSDWARG